MDSTRHEENEYSRIDYSCLTVDHESTNLTSRSQLGSSKGNTYEEPSSAVKKREQKVFEPGETLPLVNEEEGKKQNSQKSMCSIICGFLILFTLLILFILLTSALALLFCPHYMEVLKLPDGGTQEMNTQKEAMLNEEIRKLKNGTTILLATINEQKKTISEKEATIDRHVADIEEARNNASDLSNEIRKLGDEIAEKDATIGHHAADITKLKDNSKALQRKIDGQERTINDQKQKMELQTTDINKLTNSASILMDTINSQKKIISEKEAVIASRGVDINLLKIKMNEPEHTSVMLLGGYHGDITNSTTIYNSMEKNWTNCNLTLPSTLANHGAVILNNEIYIFGGYEDDTTKEPLKSLYKLGAGNKWERMTDMNEKRRSISQSSVVFNSEIWVIGGYNGTNFLKSVEKYNPKANNWTKMPELNESRTNAAATVIDGKIYISAGWDGWKTKNSVEVYDSEKEKWEIFNPSMNYAVDSHILIGNHSHLIAIGGDLSLHEPTNRVWKIDISDPKREWKEIPYLQQKRYYSGAAIIADGLMVFGGTTNKTNRIDSVEIFDGVEWKKGAPLPEIRGAFAYIPLTCAQERLFLKRFCQHS